MLSIVLPVAIGAVLGAGLGYFGQCSSGTCPLTSTWWRGSLYGAAIGAVFALSSGRTSMSGSSANSTNIVHLTPMDFDARVLQADRPVLVDFYATWCGPCKMLAPTVAKLADEFAGRALVAKVDIDKAPQLAERYRIEGVPTLLFFKQGKVVDTVVGMLSEKELKGKLDALTRLAATPATSDPNS